MCNYFPKSLMLAFIPIWGSRYSWYTKGPWSGVPLVKKQELSFCLDASLGNEEFRRGKHMLVLLAGLMLCVLIQRQRAPQSLGFSLLYGRWCYQQGLGFSRRPVVTSAVTAKRTMTKTWCNQLPLRLSYLKQMSLPERQTFFTLNCNA